MASENRNPLAELAEEMQSIINALETDNFSTVGIGNLCKARRIIAELAKVSDAIGYADEFAKDGFKECIYIPATQQLCVKKILKCRAIAEEKPT